MKVRNITNNTLYAEDVDLHIPYKDGETEEIDPDLLKKSKGLRGFIIGGMLEIVEHDPNERIENSIIYLRDKYQSSITQQETENISEIYSEPLNQSSEDIEVRLHGIFYEAGGYGKVNRNLALKLHEAGIKVKVDPKKTRNQLRESELSDIVKLTRTEISRNHITIDSVVPSFAEYSSGKYRILYTTIESYTVPKQFLESCKMYTEIWTTSTWSADILRQHVDRPIYVVPAGIDHKLYVEEGPSFDFKPNIKDFVFISVFGWGYRKGYDVLLKAYFDEFDANDNVSLLIVSRYQSQSTRFHRNKIREDIDKFIKEFPNKDMPHVVRYSHIIPEQQMPQLYRSADCFVLPSRGEGSCCVSGTKITTSAGIKDIETIVDNERVLTHKGKFEPVINTMSRWVDEDVYSIHTTMNGLTPVILTREHPVFILPRKEVLKSGKKVLEKFNLHNCKWVKDEEECSSDYVVHPLNFSDHTNGSANKGLRYINTTNSVKKGNYLFLPIKKIVKHRYTGMVYNLEVEHDNSYVTDFIVHNCLTAPEASLCGLPVIMTNVSGQQAYLRPDNAFLIEMDHLTKIRPGQMHIHFWDGQKFPALTSDKVHNQLKKSMRYVVNNPTEAQQRNKRLQKLILEKFTWNNTANAAIDRLHQIHKEIS